MEGQVTALVVDRNAQLVERRSIAKPIMAMLARPTVMARSVTSQSPKFGLQYRKAALQASRPAPAELMNRS